MVVDLNTRKIENWWFS